RALQPGAGRKALALRNGDCELEILPDVAHIDGAILMLLEAGLALAHMPLGGVADEPSVDRGYGGKISLERYTAGGNEALLYIGAGHTLSAENTRRRRHKDAADAELARNFDRMQRARTTEWQQGEAARIMAAFDRYHPDCTHHVGVDDAHDTKG